MLGRPVSRSAPDGATGSHFYKERGQLAGTVDPDGVTKLFGYNEKCSFGKISFDTTLADPKLTYEIRSIDNEKAGTYDLKLSELSHKRPAP